MMQLMNDPGTTQYDLRFSVFGIPVRVHPMFWLISLLIGSQTADLTRVLIWVACVFVSILVHELGHALAARRYGWRPDIVLHGFGGFARYNTSYGYTRRRAIWITFAGPLAGFGLYAIVKGAHLWIDAGQEDGQQWAISLMSSSAWERIRLVMGYLEWINLFWGLLNLLPVFPLDGGRICGELLNGRSSNTGQIRAHQIGIVTAVIAALFCFQIQLYLAALMFGSFAYDNYRIQHQLRRGYR